MAEKHTTNFSQCTCIEYYIWISLKARVKLRKHILGGSTMTGKTECEKRGAQTSQSVGSVLINRHVKGHVRVQKEPTTHHHPRHCAWVNFLCKKRQLYRVEDEWGLLLYRSLVIRMRRAWISRLNAIKAATE